MLIPDLELASTEVIERVCTACDLILVPPNAEKFLGLYARARVGPIPAAQIDLVEKTLDSGARQTLVVYVFRACCHASPLLKTL